MKVKSESEVTQSCLTPSDPMDCSLPGSSIQGIIQASVLEWSAIAFSFIGHSVTAIFFTETTSMCVYADVKMGLKFNGCL